MQFLVSCRSGETDRSSSSLQLARFVLGSLRGPTPKEKRHDGGPNIHRTVVLGQNICRVLLAGDMKELENFRRRAELLLLRIEEGTVELVTTD